MNIYQKLNHAKMEIANLNLKMGGKNTFANYNYYELEDFLPQLNGICQNVGIVNLVSFTAEIATLTIVDTENPEERIVVTSPMSTANLKGCHEVQNLGAVETYIKRYLYQIAFDIVEHDALNGSSGGEYPNLNIREETRTALKTAKVNEVWRKSVLDKFDGYTDDSLRKLAKAIPEKEKEFRRQELDNEAGRAF